MGSIRRSIFIFLCVLVTAATFPQENARRLVAVKKETSNTIKPQLQFSQGHTPSSLVYSPDGKYLASGGTDGTVKIWEATKGKLIRTFVSKDEDGNSRDISFVSYTPDGKTLIGADGENIYFWNVLTGKNIKTINASSSIMAYSSCGKYIAIVEKKILERITNHYI